MSDAAPDVPVESVEDKTEAKILKAEAKVETKVEEQVVRKPVEEPPPEVPPAADPEIAVTPPPPKEVKQETPRPQVPRLPAPATTAPQAIPERTAAVATAPTQGVLNRSPSNALPTWKIQVVGLLERNKRYPAAAQERRQQGVVQLFFSLDRRGHVVASRVVKSSGSAVLDQEAVALLQRAQPFPPPPPQLPGARVDLTVPIRFNLK
jgi:protein TonB